MAAIGRAARRLVEAMRQTCPVCDRPGFVGKRKAGRPCSWCETATNELWREVRQCAGCGHQATDVIDPDRMADPGACQSCNP